MGPVKNLDVIVEESTQFRRLMMETDNSSYYKKHEAGTHFLNALFLYIANSQYTRFSPNIRSLGKTLQWQQYICVLAKVPCNDHSASVR